MSMLLLLVYCLVKETLFHRAMSFCQGAPLVTPLVCQLPEV